MSTRFRIVGRRLRLIIPLVALVTLHRPAPADPTFGPRHDYAADNGPNGVDIGDLNGDGKADLAVSNGASKVAILLGNGDGTFTPMTEFAAGGGPADLFIRDLNQDGLLDLVFTNPGHFSFMRGNGNGTFLSPVTSGDGAAEHFVLGDMNGDHQLDAVMTTSTNTVAVALGNGAGGFGPGWTQFLAARSFWPTVGDFDGDGVLDAAVVIASFGVSPRVSVLHGHGDGTLGYPADFGSPWGPIATMELSGDARLDLAVCNSSGPGSVMLGNGDGTFGPGIGFTGGDTPTSIAASDLDRDGRQDIVVAYGGANKISVYPGNGDGTFQPKHDYPVGASPQTVAIGDLNNDGKPDLVVTNEGENRVSVLMNTSIVTTAVEPGPEADPRLSINPNPARVASTIQFVLDHEQRVHLAVFDAHGRLVADLADAVYPPGSHQVRWNGEGDHGKAPTGLYFVRMASGADIIVRRLMRISL